VQVHRSFSHNEPVWHREDQGTADQAKAGAGAGPVILSRTWFYSELQSTIKIEMKKSYVYPSIM